MLKYLLEKEFKQILRNRFLSKMIIVLPITTIVVFPFVTNQEVYDVKLVAVDQDHSPTSRRLLQKVEYSGYFRLTGLSDSYDEAMQDIESGDADIVFEIPQDFEHKLHREETTQVMISANSVNGIRGSLGAQYLAAVVTDYNRELREEEGNNATIAMSGIPYFDTHIRYRFNPTLDYKVFMVPGLIVVLLTLLGCALTALNIVGEKEAGTIEQINVSPVSKRLFILSKLMPNWVICFIALAFGMLFGWAVHGIVPVGNLPTILLFTAIHVRHVLFPRHHDADLRPVHPGRQHAPVDAARHVRQSHAVLRRSDAPHLPERQWHVRDASPDVHAGLLCRSVQCMGGIKLQEEPISLQRVFTRCKPNIQYNLVSLSKKSKMKKITIAIDGFSSCGKSTMAKDLAREIGYIYIDSGAMYRAVTLFCLDNGLFTGDDIDTERLEQEMGNIRISFRLNPETGRPDTYLNGVNVENRIRSMEVSAHVSPVAALPFVRQALVAQQQQMGREKGIVMDGRDIGTTVFPDAEL